jgi:hypothetical protein
MASNDIEFLNFAELFGIKLDDGNLDHNINKYNDFQNYCASSLHLGETFERACLKWKLDYDARQLAAAQPKKGLCPWLVFLYCKNNVYNANLSYFNIV